MQIPNKILVGHVEYLVEFVGYMETNEEGQLIGFCDYNKALIHIDKNLSQDRQEQVFCHELVHAIFYEAGYDEQDEDEVNRLAIVLHGMFKRGTLFIP